MSGLQLSNKKIQDSQENLNTQILTKLNGVSHQQMLIGNSSTQASSAMALVTRKNSIKQNIINNETNITNIRNINVNSGSNLLLNRGFSGVSQRSRRNKNSTQFIGQSIMPSVVDQKINIMEIMKDESMRYASSNKKEKQQNSLRDINNLKFQQRKQSSQLRNNKLTSNDLFTGKFNNNQHDRLKSGQISQQKVYQHLIQPKLSKTLSLTQRVSTFEEYGEVSPDMRYDNYIQRLYMDSDQLVNLNTDNNFHEVNQGSFINISGHPIIKLDDQSQAQQEVSLIGNNVQNQQQNDPNKFVSITLNPFEGISELNLNSSQLSYPIQDPKIEIKQSPIKVTQGKSYQPLKIKRMSLISSDDIYQKEQNQGSNQSLMQNVRHSSNHFSLNKMSHQVLLQQYSRQDSQINENKIIVQPLNTNCQSKLQSYKLPDSSQSFIGGDKQLRNQLLCQKQQLIRRLAHIQEQIISQHANQASPNKNQSQLSSFQNLDHNTSTPNLIKATAQITRSLKRIPNVFQNINTKMSYSNLLQQVHKFAVEEDTQPQQKFQGIVNGQNITSPKQLIINQSVIYINSPQNQKVYEEINNLKMFQRNKRHQYQRNLKSFTQRKEMNDNRKNYNSQATQQSQYSSNTQILNKNTSQGVFINKQIIASHESFDQNLQNAKTSKNLNPYKKLEVKPFISMIDRQMIINQRKKLVLDKQLEKDKKYNYFKYSYQTYLSPPPRNMIIQQQNNLEISSENINDIQKQNIGYQSNTSCRNSTMRKVTTRNKLKQQSQIRRDKSNIIGQVFINKSAFQNYKKLVNLAIYESQ